MPLTLTPNESAQRALHLMAARLEPIIARTLAPHLGGLEWTAFLDVMDEAKGKPSYPYNRMDPQPQLRILTERLGNLGYPFSAGRSRMVSALGSQLRIARNMVAHNAEIEPLDAWRVADAASLLLGELGDEEGAQELAAWRDQILRLNAPADDEPDHESGEDLHNGEGGAQEATKEVTTPDAEVFRIQTNEPSPTVGAGLRHERQPYDPWIPGAAGEKSVLDGVRSQHNKELLRSVLEEIVEHEGPIHIDRLATLAGRSFGFGRLETKRKDLIKRHVRKCSGLQVRGEWVWGDSVDPDQWTEFRPNDSTSERKFVEIAPQELRNASAFLRTLHPKDDQATHERRVLQTFGRRNKSKAIREHLARALD